MLGPFPDGQGSDGLGGYKGGEGKEGQGDDSQCQVLAPFRILRGELPGQRDGGGNLEAAARSLFVHANTVRYRLRRLVDVTGYDLSDPHDAFTVRIALALSRLPRGAQAAAGL